MGIIWSKKHRTFHLFNNEISYLIKVTDAGHLMHLYWGKRIYQNDLDYALNSRNYNNYLKESVGLENMHLEQLPQEFPSFGSNDMRLPALMVDFPHGARTTDFKFESFEILDGKPELEGLPSTYSDRDNVKTLIVYLIDKFEGIRVALYYSIFDDYNAIARSVKVINTNDEKVYIERIMSATVDLSNFHGDMIQLSGFWARERFYERTPLRQGVQEIFSRKGSSSHELNPLLVLADQKADEHHGDVYAMNFVYSGNFEGSVEYDSNQIARMSMGINDFDFRWSLLPGDSFQSPEVICVYSDGGLEKMSHTFHGLYANHLIRGKFKKALRPILLNNWEATYFDFDEKKILDLAKEASDLGIELFVLDDGWFGKRDSDNSSLGDWFVDERKLPSGLNSLAKNINDMGMKFGLWFEPEMISPDSDLYRSHPDWCIGIPHRRNYQARSQYILDITRPEVKQHVIDSVSTILDSANIEYVKWDYNRAFTDIYSSNLDRDDQKEFPHRYMLSLYEILEFLTTKYEDVLFESCAGGGARFDAGMLYYTPQIWTSDNTDAIERLRIQYGTSLSYPNASMGCHVSIVPNHQVHRMTPMQTRGVVAMSGNFGYELDLLKLDDKDREMVKEQISLYKGIRKTIQYGTLYRLHNYYDSNDVAWMYVSQDLNQVVVNCVRQKAMVNPPYYALKLRGLDPDATYCDGEGNRYLGSTLMRIGLVVDGLYEDFSSMQWVLEREV